MRIRYMGVVLLLGLASTWCRLEPNAQRHPGSEPAAPAMSGPPAQPRLETRPCWGAVPPVVTARCAWLVVPERRTDDRSAGRGVRLAVMILGAPGVVPSQPPTVVLGGGPGQHVIALFVDLLRRYQRLVDQGFPPPRRFMPLEDMKQFEQVMRGLVADLRKRELVLFDQRGTGFSEPALSCGGRDWAACRRRLEAAGIDVAAYNTLENAHDVNDLRLALGYAAVNLRAGSYGTRLALEVLRRHPGTVRAAVLDGVSPPQIDWGEEMAQRYDQALGVLFAHCRQDDRCRDAYPGLDRIFYDTVARLNAQPVSVPVAGHEAVLDGDDLRDMVWNALFDVQKTRWLPAMIWRASRGDTGLLGEMLAANAADHAGDTMSWGMHYSVECAGSWAFQSPARLAAAARSLNPAIRDGVVRSLGGAFGACAQWAVPPLADVHAPVPSDVPALLLSGEFDPGTPPGFADIAAQRLPRSYRFVLPYLGHTDGFTSACHASIVSAFLDEPGREPPSSCLAEMDKAAFAVQ